MGCGRIKYLTAREMSDMTQETAAEKLFMSVSNLRRIETGRQKCSDEISQAMADLYGAPWVADPTVPEDYMPMPRAQAVLNYVNEREDVEALMPRARRILADGKIDETEKPDFKIITQEIREERDAGRDLLYAI